MLMLAWLAGCGDGMTGFDRELSGSADLAHMPRGMTCDGPMITLDQSFIQIVTQVETEEVEAEDYPMFIGITNNCDEDLALRLALDFADPEGNLGELSFYLESDDVQLDDGTVEFVLPAYETDIRGLVYAYNEPQPEPEEPGEAVAEGEELPYVTVEFAWLDADVFDGSGLSIFHAESVIAGIIFNPAAYP